MTDNKVKQKPEAKKVKKYFFKSEAELGYKKRNFFIPGANQKVLVEAGKEIDEKMYNLLSSEAKSAFLTEKEVQELEKKEDK